MTIYTVGDLIKALQKYDPEESVAIRVHGGESQYFSVSEEVCQDGYLAPAPIYVYGHDADKPVYNVVFLGDDQESSSSHNRKIYRSRGNEITVEDVRTMIQRDPQPYVYTDPVTGKTSRLTEAEAEPWESVVVFSPRPGYSQLIEHYGREKGS